MLDKKKVAYIFNHNIKEKATKPHLVSPAVSIRETLSSEMSDGWNTLKVFLIYSSMKLSLRAKKNHGLYLVPEDLRPWWHQGNAPCF